MSDIVINQCTFYKVPKNIKKHSLSENSTRVITDEYAIKLLKVAEKQERRRKSLPIRQEKKASINKQLVEAKKQIFELTKKIEKSFPDVPKYIKGMGKEFYSTREWRTLRWKIVSTSSGNCSVCGRNNKNHGVILHVDHIKPRSKFPELELEQSNMQVLCADCNIGKGAKIQTF